MAGFQSSWRLSHNGSGWLAQVEFTATDEWRPGKYLASVPADRLRFSVPEGGLYLWCRLGGQVRGRAVQQHALREAMVFVAGEAFYADGGGAHELRVCYTSQPTTVANRAAECLARSLEAARRDATPATSEVPIA